MRSAITYLGSTNFRGVRKLFGIRQHDRLSHTYIIGKTGTGKTTLLDTQLRQDIVAGRGVCLIDPHGDLVESLMRWMPEERKEKVIYLNLPDENQRWGYNPLKKVSASKRPLVASGIMEVFKKLWGGGNSWGVNMEHILRNTLLTLLDQPSATFDDIPRILNDKEYRRGAIANIHNSSVRDFWRQEYEAYTKISRVNAVAPILNKVGSFLSNPILKKVLVNPEREIRLRQVMDNNTILLINLSKGKIGDDASNLFGALILTSLGLAAFSRADILEEDRVPFLIYVDEFQNLTTLSVATMFSELRKFSVGMVVSNQYLFQIDREIREAILGNVGTLISFRLGPNDARYIAREFSQVFSEEDIVHLPKYHMYLKLMIDGAPSKPFSAESVRYEDLEASESVDGETMSP